MKKELIIGVIIGIVVSLFIGYILFSEEGLIKIYSRNVGTYIYGKFNGKHQEFVIKKIDNALASSSISDTDCEDEFLKPSQEICLL